MNAIYFVEENQGVWFVRERFPHWNRTRFICGTREDAEARVVELALAFPRGGMGQGPRVAA